MDLPRILNFWTHDIVELFERRVRTVTYSPVLFLHAQRDFWKINPAHYEIQESEIQRTQTFRRVKLSMPRVMRETWRSQIFRWFRKLHVIWEWEKGNSVYSKIQESETLCTQTFRSETLRTQTFRRVKLSMPIVMRETLRTQRFRRVKLSVIKHSGEWNSTCQESWEKLCKLRDSGEWNSAYSYIQESETHHAKSQERNSATSEIQVNMKLHVIWQWDKELSVLRDLGEWNPAYSDIQESETQHDKSHEIN